MSCWQCGGAGTVSQGYGSCAQCGGSGHGSDTRVPCMGCGGSGQAASPTYVTCTACGGSGKNLESNRKAPQRTNAKGRTSPHRNKQPSKKSSDPRTVWALVGAGLGGWGAVELEISNSFDADQAWIPLAIGAAVGGVVGYVLFAYRVAVLTIAILAGAIYFHEPILAFLKDSGIINSNQ